MIIVCILILIACLVAALFCPYAILRNHRLSPLYRWTSALTGPIVGGVAYLCTFHYVHWPNSNTRFHGWPVPIVVFQRDAPGEPWLDFIGPTLVLGFPINLVLFVGTWFFGLWVLSIVISKIKRNKDRTTTKSTLSSEAAPSEVPPES